MDLRPFEEGFTGPKEGRQRVRRGSLFTRSLDSRTLSTALPCLVSFMLQEGKESVI